MAGHSKWANIVHRKTRQDAKRSAQFAKLSRLIIIAARNGGGDPDKNIRLRMAIEAARAASMPMDNIDHAIKRGTGQLEGVVYEESSYEGYGPGGSALLIEVLTDNRQRTTSELRNLLKNSGGNLGETNSVMWMFEQKGVVTVPKSAVDEETVFLTVADAGAEDVLGDDEEVWEVRCAPRDLQAVAQALRDAGLEPDRAEVTMIPTTTQMVADDVAPRLLRLLDALEDLDDVQHVYSNFEISDTILEQIEGGS
jgi:YebC/PmpR family DNA-binding regulatory protein